MSPRKNRRNENKTKNKRRNKKMGYHSGLNGEYNIPVEVNSKHIAHFRRCCKEEVPEKAIKVETYLKDDTIYFVLLFNRFYIIIMRQN